MRQSCGRESSVGGELPCDCRALRTARSDNRRRCVGSNCGTEQCEASVEEVTMWSTVIET